MPTHTQPASAIFPILLASVLAAVAVWSGIGPADRAVWWAEIIPIFAVFAALVLTYPLFRFSNAAYLLMSLWLLMHTVGAHYTFANVPFDWGNRLLAPLLGEGRNHYDRLAHYIIGFYSFPMAEWLLRRRLCGLKLALFFALFFIMSVAASYEIIEWLYAVIEGGNAGIEFLVGPAKFISRHRREAPDVQEQRVDSRTLRALTAAKASAKRLEQCPAGRWHAAASGC